MAKKFYAVKSGYTPGVYDTWEECKKQVSGYPGAIYKGFSTLEEAMEYISGSTTDKPESVQFYLSRKPLRMLMEAMIRNEKFFLMVWLCFMVGEKNTIQAV